MMKHNRTELDVDVIGGLGSLTIEDEKAISEFIKARKNEQPSKETKQVKKLSSSPRSRRKTVTTK